MKPKAKDKYVLFWFKSNKGSDFKFVFQTQLSNKEIKEYCHEWAERIIRNGSYSESVITYGYRPVAMPSRTNLLAKYRLACAAKQRATERWSVLAAMLNPQKLESSRR